MHQLHQLRGGGSEQETEEACCRCCFGGAAACFSFQSGYNSSGHTEPSSITLTQAIAYGATMFGSAGAESEGCSQVPWRACSCY
jgi:hypothetical protein